MSAPTFKSLSAELTQALAKRRGIPPSATARCTLGRDKVMVLVEYPIESESDSKKVATRTLDWLERCLRQQFDMTGLPVEVADLSESADEVAVQLYLKHISASKPFTMRSFTWKIEDGFADLFDPLEIDSSGADQVDSFLSSRRYLEKEHSLEREMALMSDMESAAPTDFSVSDVADSATDLYADLSEGIAPPAQRDNGDLNGDLMEFLVSDEVPVSTSSELDLPTIDLPVVSQSTDNKSLDFFDLDTQRSTAAKADPLDLDPSLGSDDIVTDEELIGEELIDDDLSSDAIDALFEIDETDEVDETSRLDEADEAEEIAPEEATLEKIISRDPVPTGLTPEDLTLAGLTPENLSEELTFEGISPEALALEEVTLEELAPEELAPEALEPEALQVEGVIPEEPVPDSPMSDLVSEELIAEEPTPGSFELEDPFAETPTLEVAEIPTLEDVSFELAPESAPESTAPEDVVLETVPLDELEPTLQESVYSVESETSTDAEVSAESEASAEAGASAGAEASAPGTTEAREFVLEDLVPEELASEEIPFKEIPVEDSSVDSSTESDEDLSQADTDLSEAEPILFEYDEPGGLPNVYEVIANSPSAYKKEGITEADVDRTYDDEAYSDESYGNEVYDDEAYGDEDDLENEEVYSLDGDSDLQADEDIAPIDEQEVQWQREQWAQQSKRSPWVIVGLFGFLVAGVLGFILTRPCTLGSCNRLEIARIESEEALDQLRVDDSADSIADAQQTLRRSIRRLVPIPAWSSYRDEARAAIPGYERQLNALDLVSEAQSKAYSAAVQSQDPPHSVSTWKEIATQWREAIAALTAVPDDSPVYDLAQTKLSEYRANLSTILVRVETESRAEVSLRQAQQSASQATQQAEVASSVEAWEAAAAGWETAVENLQQIPQTTQAYAEAQRMLPEYEQKLREARDRAQTERSASDRLLIAKQKAAEAQRAESESLWTLAIDSWNTALVELESIGEETAVRSEADALLAQYTESWNEAGKNQEISLRFQTIEPNFFLVCGVSRVQVCTYAVKEGGVRVDLFAGYDQVINQSITPPDQRVETVTDEQLVAQSNQLLQQITLLSKQAQIPVILHDANGAFLARYRPELDGFVRQQS